MIIFKFAYNIRVITFVVTLIYFNVNSVAQSDTAFVRIVFETGGQNLSNISKNVALVKIDKAFNILSKDKQWKKLYHCAYSLFILKNKNIISKDEAVTILQKQLQKIKSSDPLLIGQYNYLIYFILDSAGKIHTSLQFAENAYKIFEICRDSTRCYQALNGLCISNIKLRNYKQAVSYSKLALYLAHNKDKLSKGYILQNLGLSYLYNGNGFMGRVYLEKAREIFVNDLTNNYRWLSESYQAEGDNVCAMIYADSAINYALKTKSTNLVFALKRKGEVYQADGQYSKAIPYLKQALAKTDKNADPREIAKILLPLAQCEIQMGKFSLAQPYIDRGIALIGPNIAKIENARIKSIPISMADMYYLDFLYENAVIQWRLYQKSKNKAYLNETIKQLTLCTEFGDQMKLFFSNYSAKRQVAKESKKVYSLMLEAYNELYQLTKNNQYKDKAFQIAQKYNSFVLREQMNEKDALVASVKDKKLIDRYTFLKRNYLDGIESAWTDSIRHDMFTVTSLKNQFTNFSDSLERAFPKFKKYKTDLPTINNKDLAKFLQKDEAFIAYYMGDSSIFKFVITKESFELVKTTKSKEFDQHLSSYLYALSSPGTQNQQSFDDNINMKKDGFFIYQVLFSDVVLRSTIKKLVIVPDGALYRLPFDALVSDPSKGISSKDAYLISNYNTRYLYFASQLSDEFFSSNNVDIFSLGLEYDTFTLEAMKDIKKEELPDWLNMQFRSESMSHLYFSDDEAVKVADIYGGKTFINQRAIPEIVVNNATKFKLLHISAHSYADYQTPDQSAIILNKKDTQHNNLLTAEQIESLDLHAHLVTLSSCNSSSGAIDHGEGVSSLTKSFFSAGCKSVVGSYWSVSDQITLSLMEQFYTHLRNGMTKSEALKQAKLDLMDERLNIVNPLYRHPSYWAAWTMYGVDTPVIKTPKHVYLGLLSIMSISALLVAFITKPSQPVQIHSVSRIKH